MCKMTLKSITRRRRRRSQKRADFVKKFRKIQFFIVKKRHLSYAKAALTLFFAIFSSSCLSIT